MVLAAAVAAMMMIVVIDVIPRVCCNSMMESSLTCLTSTMRVLFLKLF